jgi:hypothetical protein
VVMEILGQSSFALTMDTYVQVLAPLLNDAAAAATMSATQSWFWGLCFVGTPLVATCIGVCGPAGRVRLMADSERSVK